MANSLEVKEIGKDNPNNESDYSIDSKKVKANQFVSKASTQIDPKDQIISNEGISLIIFCLILFQKLFLNDSLYNDHTLMNKRE